MQYRISFKEAFLYWLKLGFTSFGGPAGQIAMMHRDLVDRKKWIDEDRFLHALNFCMLLPGPEAQQLTIYIGWLLHGTKGGIAAGLLFILPSVLILWLLSWLYISFGNLPVAGAFFYGLKPAVVAIVAEAVIRIGKKSLKNEFFISIAVFSFAGIYFLQIPFPLIIAVAGLAGYMGGIYLPGKFILNRYNKTGSENPVEPVEYVISNHTFKDDHAKLTHSLKVIAVCLPVWIFPVFLLGITQGWNSIFIDIGTFFSKAAMVTFGGAYAVLAYISQQAVSHYNWISPAQMIDGLGLAETTPGPLIMVTQFVGYAAAFSNPNGLHPAMAGAIGGLLTTWVTFTPCFMWIFVGAPYIEKLRKNIHLSAALSLITAAVVGVVLNLSVIFTTNVIFTPKGLDWYAMTASIIAFTGMMRFKWGMIPVIAVSVLAGFVWKMLI